MPRQDIRIKFDTDNSDLDQTKKKLNDVSDAEKSVASNADKMSKSIQKGAKDASKSTTDLNASIKNVGTSLAAFVTIDAIISLGKKVIETRGEFQKLEAVLTNTLGSQSKAQKALSDINKFAATTNFGVIELTNSFVKLANRGFVPTIGELENLADLANSTGKSFDQLTEAILDAQTGEFERLKEFGIRASKQGDQVQFAFKGVKTQVKFTSSAIKEYLVGLGDLNGVQGSTEAISKTLTGQISNLGDSFDQLLNTLGQQSEGVLTGFISLLNDAIQASNDLLKTSEQRGVEQAQQIKDANAGYIQEIINNKLKNKFLKDQDAQYVAAFEDGQNQLIQAEFKAFASIQGNRIEAAKKTLDFYKLEVQDYKNVTYGMSISETNATIKQNKARLAAAQEYYDNLTASRTKQEEQLTQKLLDKEYQRQLKLIAIREKTANADADLNPMTDKVDRLAIEESFNQQRIALFRKYNQKNLDELENYNQKFETINKQRLDYLRLQEKAFNTQLSEEGRAKMEIEKEYTDSVDANNKAIKESEDALVLEQVDNIIRLKQEQEKAIKKRIQDEKNAANIILGVAQNFYQVVRQSQYQSNQVQNQENQNNRQKELDAVGDNKQRQLAINAKYDNLQRQLNIKQARQQKQDAEIQIVINGAQAVSKTYAQGGEFAFPLALLVAASVAAQLAIVQSQPEPTYAKGGFTGSGTRRDHTGERVAGIVHENEFVFDRHKTSQFRPLFEAIHRNEVTVDDLMPTTISQNAVDYAQMTHAFKRALDGQPKNEIHFDQNGFTRHLIKENKHTEYTNKRYSTK